MFCFGSKLFPQAHVFDSFAISIIWGGHGTFSIMVTHDRGYPEVIASGRT